MANKKGKLSLSKKIIYAIIFFIFTMVSIYSVYLINELSKLDKYAHEILNQHLIYIFLSIFLTLLSFFFLLIAKDD